MIRMEKRTKGEQKAYIDGFEMCAKFIEQYLSDRGKKTLEYLLIGIRNEVEIEDIEPKTDVLDNIRAKIEEEEKWLMAAGYNAYNVDIAFNSIKAVLAESEDKNENTV